MCSHNKVLCLPFWISDTRHTAGDISIIQSQMLLSTKHCDNACHSSTIALCSVSRIRMADTLNMFHKYLYCKTLSWVLCPSLVTFCSHKSGRCAVELYHAPHLWHPTFYTSPMASSALQHWTASPTKEGRHWQAGGKNHQTWQLANPAWYP